MFQLPIQEQGCHLAVNYAAVDGQDGQASAHGDMLRLTSDASTWIGQDGSKEPAGASLLQADDDSPSRLSWVRLTKPYDRPLIKTGVCSTRRQVMVASSSRLAFDQ